MIKNYPEILKQVLTSPEDVELLKIFTLLVEASETQTIPVKTSIVTNKENADRIGHHGHGKRKELNQIVLKEVGLEDPQTDDEFDAWARLYFFECGNGEPGEVRLFFGPTNCKQYKEISL